jgi:broad specificity phosphatase PhoE
VSRTTRVIFCRHGESEGNRDRRFGGHGPTPLTDHGRAQARAAGQRLARDGVDVLYTSDLARAAETAGLIGQALSLSPQVAPALRERSVGELTGLTFDEARERFPDAYAAMLRREPDACPPGGESYAQCRARAVALFEELLGRHAGTTILLVSHNLTLHQLIFHVLGIEYDERALRVYFQIDNCALHRFERHADGPWKVIALNERAHLDAL